MKNDTKNQGSDAPEYELLYHRTRADIEQYRNIPVGMRLQWLQAQMEFFHKAMPERSKAIRRKFFGH